MYQTFISGIPRPQGSKRHVGGGRMIEANKHHKGWRNTLEQHFLDAAVDPIEGAVRIRAIFNMPLPKTVKRRYPTTRSSYDVDKLCRSLLDAGSGILYHDDSQVISLNATKQYSENPGIELRVEAWEDFMRDFWG